MHLITFKFRSMVRVLLFFFPLLLAACSGLTKNKVANECPANCHEVKKAYSLVQLQEMNDEVNEASGLERSSGAGYWTHGDGGTGTKLFHISPEGKLLQKIKLDNLQNNDWEDLARDRKGNLYIGDFGNNKNDRKDLRIFKVPENNPQGKAQVIHFSFADQKSFPPAEGQRGFDTEAFFWKDGQLYLFNKNMSCRDYVRVYRLPDQPGTHTAVLVDSIRLNSQITSADLSPDGTTLVLLGLEELYLVHMNGSNSFANGKVDCLKMSGIGKTEGITFLNTSDMVLCNENGMLYKVSKNGRRKKRA